MAEPMLIDIRALLVEREDCDAGTVQQLRNALAQGGNQYRALRDVTDILKKRLAVAAGPALKKWHLKLGIALYFQGHTAEAAEHLRQAEGALANFYLGRALTSLQQFDEALKAFDRAEKAGYTSSQVQLQRAGIYRQKGDLNQARAILAKLGDLATHSAEYHFQLASIALAEGERAKAVEHLERAVELDPNHAGALFQLAHANDLAGNDEEAIAYYERCVALPPVHVGALINLGVLYEDAEKYDKAVECYRRVLSANPNDEQARLFLKDAQASQTMYYSPEEESALSRFSQVLEIPVTDFELSVRSRNCLKKMNIRTLGDLTRVTEQQLLSSKNFGETSLAEIKEMMASKGLRLGQSLEEGAQHDLRFRPQQPLSEQEQAILNKPVSELNLSVRARKCMNRLGINTLGDLVQRTADELLEAKNFGVTSLNEVREKLAQYGLTLRGE
ncbi:MAG TPA: DNA-directed RNA polymerase subunit alpha C-terminal domain-containing protein [Gemmataceae bacterium]|jgi:DNA-directed RNA polymerase subunit alpha|nr:DNA-directed RNA polymerase subunit alpha C-terminal domain-containing protein [Gemmataceae bacterium]